MKDLSQNCEILFSVNSDEALSRINFALDCLWDEDKHSVHDKVAGVMDYEELIAALLCSKKKILEMENHDA